MIKQHVFTGFGLGPIQAGLFAAEAYKSRRFERIVIAEVDQRLVNAVRANHGCYAVNVASDTGITTERVEGVEVFNPAVESDRKALIEALSQTTEIVTALPSVHFYDRGPHSVVSLIGQGLDRSRLPAVLIYASENHNHAAEILQEKLGLRLNGYQGCLQCVNTVIGKMSQVVGDFAVMVSKNLAPIAPGLKRAFLVEAFNRILVSRCDLANCKPGIEIFAEKQDLLPFEEAKLYGHNAIHALLAYLGDLHGYQKMADLAHDAQLMTIARDAFLNESGKALIRKYSSLNDPLFTDDGYAQYAEDLLRRMTNPWLDDTIERAARDPARKLGLHDRLFGTMRLCLETHVEPGKMALGAAAAVRCLARQDTAKARSCEEILKAIWGGDEDPYKSELLERTVAAYRTLDQLNEPVRIG